jgi:hypothetical protein
MRPSFLAAILSVIIPIVPVSAQTTTIGTTDGDGATGASIVISTSMSLNVPLSVADRLGKLAEEQGYRADLYARSLKECEVLLESIATKCTITSINVSTQLNSNPGQPDYLYASSTITMDVVLK